MHVSIKALLCSSGDRDGRSKARAPARVPYAVLNARGAAWKVAADIVRVQTNEMAKTARHKHLRRVTETKQRAAAGCAMYRAEAGGHHGVDVADQHSSSFEALQNEGDHFQSERQHGGLKRAT